MKSPQCFLKPKKYFFLRFFSVYLCVSLCVANSPIPAPPQNENTNKILENTQQF